MNKSELTAEAAQAAFEVLRARMAAAGEQKQQLAAFVIVIFRFYASGVLRVKRPEIFQQIAFLFIILVFHSIYSCLNTSNFRLSFR